MGTSPTTPSIEDSDWKLDYDSSEIEDETANKTFIFESNIYVDATRYIAGFYFFISFTKVIVETVGTRSEENYISLEDIGVPFDVVAMGISFFLLFILSIHTKLGYLIAMFVMVTTTVHEIYSLCMVLNELSEGFLSNAEYKKKYVSEMCYGNLTILLNTTTVVMLAILYLSILKKESGNEEVETENIESDLDSKK